MRASATSSQTLHCRVRPRVHASASVWRLKIVSAEVAIPAARARGLRASWTQCEVPGPRSRCAGGRNALICACVLHPSLQRMPVQPRRAPRSPSVSLDKNILHSALPFSSSSVLYIPPSSHFSSIHIRSSELQFAAWGRVYKLLYRCCTYSLLYHAIF